jgi:poly(3-hydroxybutyrate) depolymerase
MSLTAPGQSASRCRWRGRAAARSGADVVLHTVNGGGHSWPGGEPLPEWIAGHTTQDIDATSVMWQFFSRFSIGG